MMHAINSVYLAQIRKIMLPLPGVTEDLCYGTSAFYVQKKLIVRLREDGTTIVAYHPDRDILIRKDPDVYFITDHYRNYPSILVRLATVSPEDLAEVCTNAWQSRAPKKLIAELERTKADK